MKTDNNGSGWGSEWTRVVDVIVVGSGAAGMTAAYAAARKGASVMVLERGPVLGGTTAKSGANIWIPNNRFMRARGIADPREDALRYMAKSAYPTRYNPAHPTLGLPEAKHRLLAAFYDNAHVAVDVLIDAGILDLFETMYPDYYATMPEDKAPVGRSLRPKVWEGHRRGIDKVEGQIMIDALQAASEKLGVEIQLNSRVLHALKDESGEIVGLEVRAGRRTELIGARQGVVFGTGGFLHDERMALEYLRGPVMGGSSVETSSGDFVNIGTELGAALGNMTHAWWCQTVVEMVIRNRATVRDVYVPWGDSMFMVNRYGRRALNEKAPYNERGQVHYHWDSGRREYTNYLMFWVFDQAVIDHPDSTRHRFPIPPAGEKAEYIISGKTWDELVARIRERLATLAPHTGGVTLSPEFEQNLAATLTRFNVMAKEGKDPDFGRGDGPIDSFWSHAPRKGAVTNTMFPLADNGPYHCIILGPAALDTKGGPVIDEKARVISLSGEPIAGVYAAGNCVASPAGQAYWGGGGTVGMALTFGFIAGNEVALRPRRESATLAV